VLTRIFKYHTNFQLAFLFLSALALWLPAFFKAYPMPGPFHLSFGYNFLFWHLGNSPMISTLIAFVLLVGESVLLNEILAEYKIIPKNSYLTAFFYILLMSSTPTLLTLHPFLIVNALVIFLLLLLFKINTKDEGYKEIFLCGLLTGLCSLFYFKAAGLLIIVWIFLFIFHSFSWREWMISCMGFLCVLLYLFTYFLLSDQLSLVLNIIHVLFSKSLLTSFSWTLTTYHYITAALIAMLFLVSFVNIYIVAREKVIYVRKVFYVIFWLLLINMISLVFLTNNFIYEFSYLLFPLSILISYYYLNLKKFFWAELFLSLLVVSIILQKIFIR